MIGEVAEIVQREVVYMSDLLPLRFAGFFNELVRAFQAAGIEWRLLQGTRDVWVRDFMPVQTGPDRFVQFIYNPDYLRKSPMWRSTMSDTASICRSIGIKPEAVNLVLDGGNLERLAGKAIATDKVYAENPGCLKELLRDSLVHSLGLDQLIIIPQEPGDILGHVDGIVRILDAGTVLINDYGSKSQQRFSERIRQVLHLAGFSTIPIPYAARSDQDSMNATGVYMNFLRINNYVFLPVFGIEEDHHALKIFESLFCGYKVFPVWSNAIAAEGGVINCVTWNIADRRRPEDVLPTNCASR